MTVRSDSYQDGRLEATLHQSSGGYKGPVGQKACKQGLLSQTAKNAEESKVLLSSLTKPEALKAGCSGTVGREEDSIPHIGFSCFPRTSSSNSLLRVSLPEPQVIAQLRKLEFSCPTRPPTCNQLFLRT